MLVFTVMMAMHLTVVMSQCVFVLKSRGMFLINCRLISSSALINDQNVIIITCWHSGCPGRKAYLFLEKSLQSRHMTTQKDSQTQGELQKKF